MVANKHRPTNPFDTNQRIFNLFSLYKDIINIATKGGQPISSQDKISSAYVLRKTSGVYDIAIKDWDDMEVTQKTWACFKRHFIMAYHNLKKHSKNQVNKTMTGEIPEIIAKKLQKVSTKFNEGKQQLTIFPKAKNNLKEIPEEGNKKITSLEKTVKALDKKNNKGNQ